MPVRSKVTPDRRNSLPAMDDSAEVDERELTKGQRRRAGELPPEDEPTNQPDS